MKRFFSFIFVFFLLFVCRGEKSLVAYKKNCAVDPDGVLLEEVWQVIPREEFLRTEAGEKPFFATEVKVVYEREYLCFGLKMEMESSRMWQAMKNEKTDFVDVRFFPENGEGKLAEWEGKFHVTPLWITSSWKQSRIHPSKVRQARKYYSAEVRVPALAEEHYYCKDQKYRIVITRTSLLPSGKWQISRFQGQLLLGGLAYTDNSPRTNTKTWRNGELNTFFKRPNIRWNSNWDLGEGDYLQQGWNLNRAKGRGQFEVLAHENIVDDYYVVLRNGDFYQMYKGPEKKLRYTFRAKGKGVLLVRFLRFSFRNQGLRYLGVRSERVIKLDSDEWKTYTGTVEKQSGNESLALDFSTENSVIMLDDAFVQGIK